jgi:hypothetical protein
MKISADGIDFNYTTLLKLNLTTGDWKSVPESAYSELRQVTQQYQILYTKVTVKNIKVTTAQQNLLLGAVTDASNVTPLISDAKFILVPFTPFVKEVNKTYSIKDFDASYNIMFKTESTDQLDYIIGITIELNFNTLPDGLGFPKVESITHANKIDLNSLMFLQNSNIARAIAENYNNNLSAESDLKLKHKPSNRKFQLG